MLHGLGLLWIRIIYIISLRNIGVSQALSCSPLPCTLMFPLTAEEDEHGNVDIPQLLTMVQTSNLPTLRRTIFELKYRVYEQETREDEEIVVLSNMVDQLTNVLGGLNRKVDALGASSASAGSTMSSVIYA